IAWMIAYGAAMVFVIRALVERLAKSDDERPAPSLRAQGSILLLLTFSSAATNRIGIHALFGAFMAGALVPTKSRLANELRRKLQRPVEVFLLPVFFASAGLRTEIGLLRVSTEWWLCALIVAVAFLGKLGGTFVAARIAGEDSRQAAMLGVL